MRLTASSPATPQHEPSRARGRRRRCAWRLLVACSLTCCWVGLATPLRAQSQPSWWGWGAAGNPTATWNPELVADYLLSGQPPHPAVVRIVAPEHSGTSLGSGVLVDVNRSQGLVLTNWHVIRESRSAVLVQFPDGFQSAGTVIRWDEAWDLAAVVIWKPAAIPVTIAPQPPVIGEPLTIAGFGRGSYREQTGPCTEYLSPGTGYAKEFVELQASARQGDSGGPIFNERRELAGVLFGQNDGRTIGSCSARVRVFLASAGSTGFTPTPIAEFSAARALDRGLGEEAELRPRLAAAETEPPIQRSTHVAAPLIAQMPLPTGQPMPPSGWPVPQAGFAAPPQGGRVTVGSMPPDQPPSATARIAELLDPFAQGSTLLTTSGGIALAVLGMRIMFGGRRAESRGRGPARQVISDWESD